MALVAKAPINIPLYLENTSQLTPAWQYWFESVDRRIQEVQGGGSVGDVLGDSNTGFTISATANIYINGIRITNPPGEGYVAITDGTDMSWISPEELAAIPVAVIRPMIDASIPDGWVLLDDGTIGSASSGASNRANADCEDLFLHLWNNISDTYAPVTGGRGASAAADWAANKKIQLGFFEGRGVRVMGGSGTIGVTNGAETETMTENMVTEHIHTFQAKLFIGLGGSTLNIASDEPRTKPAESDPSYDSSYTTMNGLGSDIQRIVQPAGEASPDPQNILQETVFFKYMMKL